MAGPSSTSASTGCTIPSQSKHWAAAAVTGRAARLSAVPDRSTRWSMSAASRTISMIGRRWAIPAGAGVMSCRSSRRARILIAIARTMAAAARNTSPTSPPLFTRSATASSKAPRHWGFSRPVISMAAARKGSGSITSTPAAAGAPQPRTPFCARRWGAEIWNCGPRPSPAGSCLRAPARSAWNTPGAAQSARFVPGAK